MTDITSQTTDGVPTYLESGDPALADYYPAWVGNLADDVTIEGSLLDGAAQGTDAARTIVGTIRALYNDAGQTEHIAANYRPLSSLLLLSRLVGEKLAGTPHAKYFLASESSKPTAVRRAP